MNAKDLAGRATCSIAEAAEILRMSEATVRRRIKEGAIKSLQLTTRGRVVVPVAPLLELVERGTDGGLRPALRIVEGGSE